MPTRSDVSHAQLNSFKYFYNTPNIEDDQTTAARDATVAMGLQMPAVRTSTLLLASHWNADTDERTAAVPSSR